MLQDAPCCTRMHRDARALRSSKTKPKSRRCRAEKVFRASDVRVVRLSADDSKGDSWFTPYVLYSFHLAEVPFTVARIPQLAIRQPTRISLWCLPVGPQNLEIDFAARSFFPARSVFFLLAIRSPSILGQDAGLFPLVTGKVKRFGPRTPNSLEGDNTWVASFTSET